tara:strand:- start:1391 stop:2500 length:1110 start_codon:yes stop_codon:yes gene_type:complete
MASSFKTLTNNDVVTSRTVLHEAIPITGSVVTGTYSERNIKNYSHGMFQSVYDYPYLSSSANHIFDITLGYSGSYSSSAHTQNDKKLNIYNQMAQVLVGYDEDGNIRAFDQDGNLTGGNKFNSCYFLSFSRLLVKDEIKKGGFIMSFHTGGHWNDLRGYTATTYGIWRGTDKTTDAVSGTAGLLSIQDHGAQNNYFVNSPAGEYGILYTASAARQGTGVGLIYYQAGIVVLSSSIFGTQGMVGDDVIPVATGPKSEHVHAVITGSSIQNNCDSIRHRLYDIDFNNTVELNSTIYYCRAHHNEFNYSSNPTYVSASKIVTKNVSSDTPVSYISTIGLYSPDNELLAVAKLSEPLKKDPTTELTLRVRLDY